MSWRCQQCGAEHADKILFCTACGAERVRSEAGKREYTGWWHQRSTDVVLLILWLIVCGGIVANPCGRYFNVPPQLAAPLAILVVTMLYTNCLLVPVVLIVALLRLFFSRALPLGLRVVLTIVILATFFVSVRMAPALTQASWARRMNAADTNALVQACTYIIRNPGKFQKESYYDAALTTLPPAIVSVNPVYVWIRTNSIRIALIGGMDHRGWLFVRTDDGRWDFLTYDEYTETVLLSNIAVAAHQEHSAE